MEIGRAVYWLRTLQGINQRELAEKLGISKTYMSLMERGDRFVGKPTREKVMELFKVPETVLVFLREYDKLEQEHPALVQAVFSAYPVLADVVELEKLHPQHTPDDDELPTLLKENKLRTGKQLQEAL